LIEEFECWLQDRLAETAAAVGDRASGPVRITPPVAEWEMRCIGQAVRDDLFCADGGGSIASELLEHHGVATRYPIFSENPPYRLLRENVCQLAAAARLIYERGWLRRHLSLQPGRPEHRSSSGGFDLLVRFGPDQILIWVETKRSTVELEKFVADLRACSRRGLHAQAECGFPQNHPRYEFCLAARPEFLWAVAPDGDFAFTVGLEGNAVELELLPSLPARSYLELR
jgi:hypothetical protein